MINQEIRITPGDLDGSSDQVDEADEVEVTQDEIDSAATSNRLVEITCTPEDFDEFDIVLAGIAQQEGENFIIRLIEEPPHHMNPRWKVANKRLESVIANMVEKLQVEPKEEVTVSANDDIDEQTIYISRDIDEQEIVDFEAEQILRLYRGINYDSGRHMVNAPQQLAPLSCTLATCAYAYNAITESAEMSEYDLHEIIKGMRQGSRDSDLVASTIASDLVEHQFNPEQISLPIGQIEALDTRIQRAILRGKGLQTDPIVNTLTLINELEKGNVAIFDVGGHSKLIQGVEIRNGDIFFSVVDPLGSNREPEDWPFEQISRMIARVSNRFDQEHLCNFFVVKKPEILIIHAEDVEIG